LKPPVVVNRMKDSESEDEEVVSVDSELNEYNPESQ